jgi:hypothetical protein
LLISAQAKTSPSVSTETLSHSFWIHMIFKRSNAYLSAEAREDA